MINENADKVMHTAINALTALLTTFFVAKAGASVAVAMLVATILCILISVGKEVYDSKQEGNKFDWHDIIADAIGMAIGLFLGYMVFNAPDY